MKLLFDYQAFEMQTFGGVSRLFFELLCRSDENGQPEWDLPIKYSANEYLKTLPQYRNKILPTPDPYKDFWGGKPFRGKARLYNLLNRVSRPPDFTDFNRQLSVHEINKSQFDIFHPTYYDEYFLECLGNKPYVVTVYDMIHEIFPEYFFKRSVMSSKKMVLDRAARIIAISQNTKKDLINCLAIPEKKIDVIYLGNSLARFSKDTKVETTIPEKYILHVGHRRMYKNFYFFLNSILPVLQQDSAIHVVCTGTDFDKYDIQYFCNLKIDDRVHHCYVDDAALAYLYKNAQLLVFPSLYEGFGLPVLEAFGCNCPVALSNTSSLPEVGGDAAIYFDPKNPVSIREAVRKILYDNDLRKELITKGSKRLGLFSWQRMYEQTLEVYHKIVG